MPGAKEEPRLAEVKAVLMKLQRLDLGEEGQEPRADAPSPRPGASGPAALAIFDRKLAASEVAAPKAQRKPRYALYLGAAGAVIAFALAVAPASKNTPSNASAQQKDNVVVLISEARRILNEGDVILARARLIQAQPERRPEVALMLAQSYDPNFLRALSKTDAKPDASEAARWYRKWYELAAQSGLEMDGERLQRIINAMN